MQTQTWTAGPGIGCRNAPMSGWFRSPGRRRGHPRRSRTHLKSNRGAFGLARLVLVASLGLAATACDRTEIGKIVGDPGSYMDSEVQVGGEVVESYGLLNYGVYRIDDGTGSLWVYSAERGVPSRGTRVAVKGTIEPTLFLMGRNFATVLHEQDRRRLN